jgi:hypothetical protein
VVERTEEGKELPIQRPVYYLSEVLTLSKQNYPHYPKPLYRLHTFLPVLWSRSGAAH